MNQDEEHLKLLTIFHYVVAGLMGLFSLFPVIHLVVGLCLVFYRDKFHDSKGALPPEFIGWLFVAVAGFIIICGLTMACLIFAAGRCLAKRKAYNFCFVVACLECVLMPFGTVLGVFTIVMLGKQGVKGMFGKS